MSAIARADNAGAEQRRAVLAQVVPLSLLGTVILSAGALVTRGVLRARGPRGLSPALRQAASSVVALQHAKAGRLSGGSGWIAAPGIVVTNHHAVAGANQLMVYAPRRSGPLYGKVLESDPVTDLAVVRVEHLTGRPLQMSDAHPVGDHYTTVGYPDFEPLSAVKTRVGDDWGPILTEDEVGVHTQAVTHSAARHGNSGGPILDREGRVIGTVASVFTGKRAGGVGSVLNRDVRAILQRAGIDVPS